MLRWLISLLWYFYSVFIELRHLAYGVIWTITYIWSFLAFLVNWVTFVYAMMAYFTLPTIQSSFLHSNLHHSKMLFWGIAIYYYMMFSFGLFLRRLRYANSFVIQIWFLHNISHFRSLPDFSALFKPKLLFSPDAQCSWCLFFSVLPVMKMSSHVTWEYILMIFAGLRLLCWEVSSNARSLSLPSFLSDVLHHDLLTPSKFQILECFFMILTNQGYHSKTAIHVNTAFAQCFQIFLKNFFSCCFRQCSHQIVSGYVSDVYRLD